MENRADKREPHSDHRGRPETIELLVTPTAEAGQLREIVLVLVLVLAVFRFSFFVSISVSIRYRRAL